MRVLRLACLTLASSLLTVLALPTPLLAQYMYMDANGDGINTAADVMGPVGVPVTVDVWLDPTRNRDGSPASCSVEPSANMAVWNSYSIAANVAGGTASFSGFVNRLSLFGIPCLPGNVEFLSNETEMAACRAGFPTNLGGPLRICTFTVTTLSGAPTLGIVPANSLSIDYGTTFGSQCPGNGFDNTMRLGSDWFDADGLGVGSSCAGSCPPVLNAIANMTVNEGSVATQTIAATDPEGQPVQFQKLFGPAYMTVSTTNASAGQGLITLSPGYSDAVSGEQAAVRASDGTLTSNTRTFLINVLNVNGPPVSDPGGPYSGVPGIPVAFDGSGSFDPEGDALLYGWSFGDGVTGSGPTPTHIYAAAGTYTVSLTVVDGVHSITATTTATITDVFAARAFTTKANRVIKLGSGKRYWTIQIEPIGRSFDLGTVGLGTVRMISNGTGTVSEVHVALNKSSTAGDADGNGVSDISATFLKSDLQMLFSNLNGSTSVPVTLEGQLTSGGIFRAQTDVGIQTGGGGSNAAVFPNPLNPSGEVQFTTSRAGRIRVDLFDASGRLVRVLADRDAAKGEQSVAVDGRTRSGAPLASGVYYVRVTTPNGSETLRVAVLK